MAGVLCLLFLLIVVCVATCAGCSVCVLVRTLCVIAGLLCDFMSWSYSALYHEPASQTCLLPSLTPSSSPFPLTGMCTAG